MPGHPLFTAPIARAAGGTDLSLPQDLRAEIQRHPATPPQQVPPQRQRASDTSLLRRLEAATARIRHLETDNQQLRDLARALGERRAIEVLGQANGRDTPKKNSPKIIGPC